jgi:hypothetical protein
VPLVCIFIRQKKEYIGILINSKGRTYIGVKVRHDHHVDFSVECGSTITRDRPRPNDHRLIRHHRTYMFVVLVGVFMFIEEARISDLSAKMEEAFCRGWRRVAVVMSLI